VRRNARRIRSRSRKPDSRATTSAGNWPSSNHQPRTFDAQILDRLGRRLPGLRPKSTTELALAQMGNLGEPLDGELGAQVSSGIYEGALDAVGLRLQSRERRELRLT
jgi:hypothetical protein